MDLIIAGGTGFIGRHLVGYWLEKGKKVAVLGRSAVKIKEIFGQRVKSLTWGDLNSEDFEGVELVVNLAGANVREKRWTTAYKKEMLDSRLETDSKLLSLINKLPGNKPSVFLASAVSVYGKHATTKISPLDERTEIKTTRAETFSEEICCRVENLATEAHNIRLVFLRFGAVLSKDGGALAAMLIPFRYGLGGKVGNGMQPFNWIAMADLLSAIEFLLENIDITGPVNMVSPQMISQFEFAKALGKTLGRPTWLPLPEQVMRLVYGEVAELFLEGNFIKPRVLTEKGFVFSYPEIDVALKAILSQES